MTMTNAYDNIPTELTIFGFNYLKLLLTVYNKRNSCKQNVVVNE